MKLVTYFRTVVIVGMLILTQSCSKFLDEEIYSQLAPDNYLNTKEGIESVLADAYARAANMNSNNSIYVIAPQELTTDILYQSGDNIERDARDYINFNWHPSIDFLTTNWDPPYQAIRDVNILLENIESANITEDEKNGYSAELTFLRAISYYKLYFMFGPVPLRTNTSQSLQLEKASDVEIVTFIETELLASMEGLPEPGNVNSIGRAHKAAAMGYLSKFYLNTKQWQKCADITKRLINEFNYSLFPDYKKMFSVENEQNAEYIWVRPAFASSDRATANSWMNVSFPDAFAEEPVSGLKFLPTWLNWPNEFRIYDSFYNSFDSADKRRSLLITSYVNSSGEIISLLGNDNIRSFKYWPDPNAQGASHGNDIPEIRYADILLARAEALNELEGPNLESIALINDIRLRAGLAVVSIEDFPDKNTLRDHILQERGWEFYSEGHRRMDLIRMGKYISGALNRGKANAKPHHVLFPIPQAVIDSDPLLIQNDGY